MIIISGTGIEPVDFPLSSIVNYEVENNSSILLIKLKTVAKTSTCQGVYLHEDYRTKLAVPKDLGDKVKFFKNDQDLLKQLSASNNKSTLVAQPEPIFEPEPIPEVEAPTELSKYPQHQPLELKPKTVVPSFEEQKSTGSFTIEKANVRIPDTYMNIPNMSNNMDSNQYILQMKDNQIHNLQQKLLESNREKDDIYRLQEAQLLEMQQSYDKEVDKANKTIKNLEKTLKERELPQDYKDFLQFASYAKTPDATIKAGFTQAEVKEMGPITSNIYILACSAGDSLYDMMSNINNLILKHPNALIVDFTFDFYFCGQTSFPQDVLTSTDLNNRQVKVADTILGVSGGKLIPTGFYHDISLLSMNWSHILNKLMKEAKGEPIFFIFNSISSFAVRHTVSKLATLGDLYLFVKSNPVVLTTLYGEVQYFDKSRINIVATSYFEEVKALLLKFSERYHVIAAPSYFEWGKLDLTRKQ